MYQIPKNIIIYENIHPALIRLTTKFYEYFSDEFRCAEYLFKIRAQAGFWGSMLNNIDKCNPSKNFRYYICNSSQYRYYLTSGTVFDGAHISLVQLFSFLNSYDLSENNNPNVSRPTYYKYKKLLKPLRDGYQKLEDSKELALIEYLFGWHVFLFCQNGYNFNWDDTLDCARSTVLFSNI